MQNKKIIIHHHLGMGDHICLSGLIRHLYENYDHIILLTKANNRNNVEYLFRDLIRIQVEDIGLPRDVWEELKLAQIVCQNYPDYEYIKIGFESHQVLSEAHPDKVCDELFYMQMNVPYEYRFSKFYFKRDLAKENDSFDLVNPNNEDYIFIHDNPEIGVVIDVETSFKIIKNDIRVPLLHFGKILENAKEVHLMESSIRCLIEDPRLNLQGKLFYHTSRGGYIANNNTTKLT